MSARTERWIKRAERLEDYWRDFAFLGLTEKLRIAGGHSIEVRLLTLRMFVELCAIQSPFIIGGKIGPEDVAVLLWRLSPMYDTRSDKRWLWLKFRRRNAQREFMRSIKRLPFRSSLRACDRYLDRMLIDRPPTTATKQAQCKPDTGFAANMIHQLASAYGWNDDQILDLPMPRLFQYLRRIQRAINSELSRFNPIRDRMAKKITSKVIAARKARRKTPNGVAC